MSSQRRSVRNTTQSAVACGLHANVLYGSIKPWRAFENGSRKWAYFEIAWDRIAGRDRMGFVRDVGLELVEQEKIVSLLQAAILPVRQRFDGSSLTGCLRV